MKFDPLQHYAHHILSASIYSLRPPAGGAYQSLLTKGLVCTVLDRQGQFQTELIMIPHSIKTIERHTHPGIDTFEYHVTGDFQFSIGADMVPSTIHEGAALGEVNQLVSVPQDLVHGGGFKEGGSFLSFQHYLNGVPPTTVGSSYKMSTE